MVRKRTLLGHGAARAPTPHPPRASPRAPPRDRDVDGDGEVTKKEFRKAMAVLGFEVSRAVMDEVFDSFDADGGGSISFKELQRCLHLSAGAAGKAAKAAEAKKLKEYKEMMGR